MKMVDNVRFLLAIPILQPEETSKFIGATPVAGVIFVDSTAERFYVDDAQLELLVSMTKRFVDGLVRKPEPGSDNAAGISSARIRNVPLRRPGSPLNDSEPLPSDVSDAFELCTIAPPKTTDAFQFNFDYSDFVPVEE
jgi:hypothetical protein